MENTYRTKDFYEASFLYACRNKMLGLERDPIKNCCWFIFDKECEETAGEYWQGVALVNAKDYSNSIRNLKDRIFSK